MDLILENDLEHQQKPVQYLSDVFKDVSITRGESFCQNPIINISDTLIENNIINIQKNISPSERGVKIDNDILKLDIKMETGTGKTYVYVKSIFDLHYKYGFNKFIIAVPSLAIKAGIKQFINDSYVIRNFKDNCGYKSEIELSVLEAHKTKKGKLYFPTEIREFVKGSANVRNKIYVLLVNMQLLTSGKMLSRDDYDYGVEGYYRPFDALKYTKPIVIIDEPHRFNKSQKAYKTIENEIHPQVIIRYGATFPDKSTKKEKYTTKDYDNLLYDLNGRDAFNKNLIKGIAKEHFESFTKKPEKIKIIDINSKESVVIQYIKKGERAKRYVLKHGDMLSSINENFGNLEITSIGKNFIELSNGQIKHKNEEMTVDIYSSSYQEQMIRLALERHFKTEKENFLRNNRIKTLCLFFIDDISSYRQDKSSKKDPYLKKIFKRLLKEKIDSELSKIEKGQEEYRNYLIASKNNIDACHAGYFSRDNDDTDEKIAEEVNEILFDKKKLLSIRNSDNTYNTRRFLFSKWTLKEGWDNPNVFTIAKLRASGSENSKLQEVGRGLRLPVDENGNRISNETFLLNYIVDFTEEDFAKRLVDEINKDIPTVMKISEEKIESVAKKLKINADDLFIDLITKKYIDRIMHDGFYEIKMENRDAFFDEYPQFNEGIENGKIVDRNKQKPKNIRIRIDKFDEIKELWSKINERYILCYEPKLNMDLPNVVKKIIEDNVFADMIVSSYREQITSKNDKLEIIEQTGVQYKVNHKMPYCEFLRRINRITNIPVSILHKEICNYSKKTGGINNSSFNEHTLGNFISKFSDWKNENLQGRFQYKKVNINRKETALTYKDGSPKNHIVQGRIGTKTIPSIPSKKYLYDVIAFDSMLEKEDIMTEIEEVIVYGKIPRKSIAIPTITGQTYSPDFMYVVKKKNGEKELNIVVETKDVEGKTQLRGAENAKIECAKIFFNQLSKDGFKVSFQNQLNDKKISEIIMDTLE